MTNITLLSHMSDQEVFVAWRSCCGASNCRCSEVEWREDLYVELVERGIDPTAPTFHKITRREAA